MLLDHDYDEGDLDIWQERQREIWESLGIDEDEDDADDRPPFPWSDKAKEIMAAGQDPWDMVRAFIKYGR